MTTPAPEFIRRPDGLGEPLGLYSHVAVVPAGAKLVVVAGQVGLNADGVAAGGLEEQTRKAFENLGTALKAGGAEYADLVKTTTLLVGAESIPVFMAARRAVFAEIFPAGIYPPNTLLVISRLVEEGLLVEIEGLAVTRSSTD